MHNRFVIRRQANGDHQIVDIHGNLVATMNGEHPDVDEIAALFLQAPIADYLARAAQPYVDNRQGASRINPLDWLLSLRHYRESLGEEVPQT